MNLIKDKIFRWTLLHMAALVTGASHANTITGFTGDFAPANWSISVNDGSVNNFSANELVIVGGDLGQQSYSDVYIVLPNRTRISFDWHYSTEDSEPYFDPFGISLDSGSGLIFLDVSNNEIGAPLYQSGSYQIELDSGTLFAFTEWSRDGTFGAATAGISNFRAETIQVAAIPEASTYYLMLLGIGIIVVNARLRRVQFTVAGHATS